MNTLNIGEASDSPIWIRRGRALDCAIDLALEEQRIVGAVVLVSLQGTSVYQRAAGLADREAGRPFQPDALFRYSSLTKPIVTAAALALVAERKLDLYEPVTRWLPQFRPRLPNGAEATITLHQLLTHTAGLTYPFWEPADGPYHRAGIDIGIDASDVPTLENMGRLATVPLSFVPGEIWRYSVALDVVGAIIERACGETLPQAVARLVTSPLKMNDTAFEVVDQARLAVPYADAKAVPVRMGEPHDLPFGASYLRFSPGRALNSNAPPSGGAGMIGSAPDLLRFLEAIRNGGGGILPPDMAAQMLRNQTGSLPLDAIGPGWSFGYGGAVLVDAAAAQTPQSAGTWCWGGVYGHSWFIDPAQAMTVIIATNTGVEGMMGKFTIDVRDAVYV